jgi:hypothetical protein
MASSHKPDIQQRLKQQRSLRRLPSEWSVMRVAW